MSEIKMGTAESRFADMIWENEPITSGELAKMGLSALNWKKTTCHTVLKRLCDRGLFQNVGGVVTSLISREEYYSRHSEAFVQEAFGGSLPAFLVAFTRRKRLSDGEVEELKALIDTMRRDDHA